jgi:hypothetical protein
MIWKSENRRRTADGFNIFLSSLRLLILANITYRFIKMLPKMPDTCGSHFFLRTEIFHLVFFNVIQPIKFSRKPSSNCSQQVCKTTVFGYVPKWPHYLQVLTKKISNNLWTYKESRGTIAIFVSASIRHLGWNFFQAQLLS